MSDEAYKHAHTYSCTPTLELYHPVDVFPVNPCSPTTSASLTQEHGCFSSAVSIKTFFANFVMPSGLHMTRCAYTSDLEKAVFAHRH